MKIRNLIFILMIGLTFASCSKDDDATCTDLSETIIGDWSVSNGIESGNVTFLAGGELSDPDGILIEGEANGSVFDQKSWELDGEEKLTISATDGTQSAEAIFDVKSFDCDNFELSIGGIINVDFSRR